MLKLMIIVGLVVVAASVLLGFFTDLFAVPDPRLEMAKSVLAEAAEEVVDIAEDESAVVVSLFRDRDEKVTTIFLDQLLEQDSSVIEGDAVELKKREFFRNDEPRIEVITRLARDRGARYIVWGEVKRFSRNGPDVEVAVRIVCEDTEGNTRSFDDEFEDEKAGNILDGVLFATQSIPILYRVFGWLVIVLVLPLAIFSLLQRILELESNLANALTLGGITCLDALLAWLAVGYDISAFMVGLILVAAVTLGGAYNYWVLDRLAG